MNGIYWFKQIYIFRQLEKNVAYKQTHTEEIDDWINGNETWDEII